MAYFNRLPNIEFEERPLVFPFSEKDYVLAKNFFKRYKVTESSDEVKITLQQTCAHNIYLTLI